MPPTISNTLSEKIAECALDHYHNVLPSNNGGKPQKGKEWTVYAAIVAVRSLCTTNGAEQMWIVSCATGSKCTSVNSIVSTFPTTNRINSTDESIIQAYNGLVLKDSHAEVLARRGLTAVLWDEIEIALHQSKTEIVSEVMKMTEDKQSKRLLEVLPSENKLGLMQFYLKKDITLHMYISDSPCGDATIYDIKKLKDSSEKNKTILDGMKSSESEAQFRTEINFTGAKLILNNQDIASNINATNLSKNECRLSSIITITNNHVPKDEMKGNRLSTVKLGREQIQQLGALRLKSSRSNIPSYLRSTSMSCADKLARWCILGMQGSILTTFIPEPICLSSICVSKDPRSVNNGQLNALNRALRERVISSLEVFRQKEKCLNKIPPFVAIVDRSYKSSKSESEYRLMMSQYNNRKRNDVTDCDVHESDSNKKTKIDINNSEKVLCSNKTSFQPNECRRIPKRESPSGMSINWYQLQNDEGKNVEITVGATGLKRGKKPKQPLDVTKSASRLCRYKFVSKWKKCIMLSKQIDTKCKEILNEQKSYIQLKKKLVELNITQNVEYIFNNLGDCDWPLKGWVRSGADNDFKIT